LLPKTPKPLINLSQIKSELNWCDLGTSTIINFLTIYTVSA